MLCNCLAAEGLTLKNPASSPVQSFRTTSLFEPPLCCHMRGCLLLLLFPHHKPKIPLPFLWINCRLASHFNALPILSLHPSNLLLLRLHPTLFCHSNKCIAGYIGSQCIGSHLCPSVIDSQTQGDKETGRLVWTSAVLCLLLCLCMFTHTHTHTPQLITSLFISLPQSKPPPPPRHCYNPLPTHPHVSLCGQQWSHDPRHGVRSSRQRELDHPSPNAIQIKECIQRKWPRHNNNQSGFSWNIQARWRVRFSSTMTFSTSDLWSSRIVMAAMCFRVVYEPKPLDLSFSSPIFFFFVFILLTALVNVLFSLLIFFQYDRLNLIKVSISSCFHLTHWQSPLAPIKSPGPPLPL